VALMYLVDTNVFLEILLLQKKKDDCKRFLDENGGELYLTDFSLHSIGVILFRHKREELFRKFASDTLNRMEIITLSKDAYQHLPETRKTTNLDFDDAYQFLVANENELAIVTLDGDFERVKGKVPIRFL
jgi:predicted nucleic acid-binding protein